MKIAHLLNFSSGLYYPIKEDIVFVIPEPYATTYNQNEDVHERFFNVLKGPYPAIPLQFEPGTDFTYGWSSDILDFIVEKLSGKTLEVYCQENMSGPLGLTTSFYLTPEIKEKLIPLTYGNQQTGSFEPWAEQMKLIQMDPGKA
ncbi:unnamed protein product [Cyclocybe aegerita]|uniref:Beta-lactamase-related domain-containing protein n=1 Tax=Cyclocybe aegerita TaxID=1973307 RepID=A0A8S0XZP2_CYCAE|nr:unnamed protein product [Cyclocybe aegerita]